MRKRGMRPKKGKLSRAAVSERQKNGKNGKIGKGRTQEVVA